MSHIIRIKPNQTRTKDFENNEEDKKLYSQIERALSDDLTVEQILELNQKIEKLSTKFESIQNGRFQLTTPLRKSKT